MNESWKKGRLFTVIGIFALIFMASVATAAPPPTRYNRQRILEKIETIKMWKLMDALNLDSKTALKVFPIIKEMDQKRLQLREKKHKILQQINQIIQNGKINQNIDTLASKLFALKTEISNISREEYQKLKSVFSERQLAEFLLFQQRFRRALIHRWLNERHGPTWRAQGNRRGRQRRTYQGQK